MNFLAKLAVSQEMLQQFGQLIFLVSQNTTGIGFVEKAAIRQLDDLTANGVEKVMKEHRLDAIVAPDSVLPRSWPSMASLGLLFQLATMRRGHRLG